MDDLSVTSERVDAIVLDDAAPTAGASCDVRLLLPDLMGMARGKYLSSAQLAKPLSLAAAMYLVGHDVEPLELPGLSSDEGFPDVLVRTEPETLRAGWHDGEQLILGSSFEPDGSPFRLDPRHALRRVVGAWEELGMEPRVALELEFFVLEPDGSGGWRAPTIPAARPYGTGPDVDPLKVGPRLIAAMREAGICAEGMISEFYAGQFEVNLGAQSAMKACDDAFVLRLLVREVIHEMGLKATFMPRPLNDRGGNGLHVNMSFWRDGENVLEDPDSPDGIAPPASQAIAGLLRHHRPMTALLAPTVNSYKRLHPDLMAGYYADWGHDNRFVTVRVPAARGAATRIEARQADASGSPHLAVATLLAVALDGVRRELQPPAPRKGTAVDDTVDTVPATLGEALDALEGDFRERFGDLLGPELLTAFLLLKRHEWERYSTHVTDWELSEYLPHH